MELRPDLYRFFIRPGWFTRRYISSAICGKFDFNDKFVLEFGSGVGTNSQVFHPSYYLGADCDGKRVSYASKLFPKYSFITIKGSLLPLQNNTVDYILIISVLHHIKTELIPDYLEEFRRVLKSSGAIIILEPYFIKRSGLNYLLMKCFDRGKYIQAEGDYIGLFENNRFKTDVVMRFTQLLIYKKILFCAFPVD